MSSAVEVPGVGHKADISTTCREWLDGTAGGGHTVSAVALNFSSAFST